MLLPDKPQKPMEGHDKKDNIAFLKNEYGTGGSSHALPGSDRAHEDHDAKGIRLEKGNYGSPYAKVLLNWNVVEKRIRELVQADKYLSPEGKEAYAQYKQEQAEKAMQKEQAKLERGVTNQELDRETGTVEGYRTDILTYTAHKPVDKDVFSMKIGNRTYTDKKEAGAALIDMCRSAKQPNMAVTIGEYQGFKMSVSFDSFFSKFTVSLKGSLSHEVEIGADPLGNLQRLSNALEGMTGKMADVEQKLSNVEHQLETAKVEVTKPFAQEQELAEKLERLAELNALLNMDEKGDNALDMGDDEPEDENGEQSAQAQEGEPDRAEDIQAVADEPLKPVASFLMSERIAEHDKERMLADGSRGRVSVKEKLAEMKQKISDQKMPEKPETVKSKGKEESL